MSKYLDLRNDLDFEKLQESAQIIKQGGLVVFPTETVYGIGTNGLDEKAIRRLYEVKKRPFTKPISLLVSNIEMVEQIAKDITDIEYKIMQAFFPGPLTIILKKKKAISNMLTANSDTVGIRMPKGKVARKILEYANIPIATPSANISGKPSGTNIQSIMKDFENKVEYYVDTGESEIGTSSTIVRVVNGVPTILRQGSITKEQIDSILRK